MVAVGGSFCRPTLIRLVEEPLRAGSHGIGPGRDG
jgi:hypothetical protein